MPSWALIASKDLRLLWRDRVALFWVVAFPLAFAVFFGSVMKPGDGAGTESIAVVVVKTGAAPGAPPAAAEDRLAAFLEEAGLQVTRASEAAARDAVRRGRAVAFVRAPAGAREPILLGIDPSRRSEAALLESLLGAAPGAPAAGPRAGVETERIVRAGGTPSSGFQIVFPAMLLWGLLGCAATFAISMVAERASGTLLRLRAAPVRRASILGGKAAACAVACLADVLLLTGVGSLLLGVRIGDPAKYAAAVAAMVACFAGLTMLLSVLGRTEQGVAGAGWATLILMAMLGGAMVPLALFPDWMLALSDVSPVKWGILALEGATWRDFAWRELARPLAVLIATGSLGFVSGVGVLVASREV